MIKFLGALIGFVVLRIPGAILGYLIGSFIDNMKVSTVNLNDQPFSGRRNYGPAEFSHSFLVLTAAVLKADGSVTRNELEFVKELYKQNFGLEKTKADMLVLRDILQGPINWEAACIGINQNMIKTERVKLIHYLFGIARADGQISNQELNVIRSIARLINLSQWDFDAVRMKFMDAYSQSEYQESYSGNYRQRQYSSYTQREDPYKIMALSSSATDEEVKSTYRKLVRQYHPDKHASKSQEEVRKAEEQFKKIQEAYNEIKKERGL